MSTLTPAMQTINGSGKPRLIVVYHCAKGLVASIVTVEEDGKYYAVVTTYDRHKLSGEPGTIRISGCSVNNYNGDWEYIVTSDYSFKFEISSSANEASDGIYEEIRYDYESTSAVTYDATHIYESGLPVAKLRVNQRVSSQKIVAEQVYPTYSKIIAIADGVITIEGWSNGTPTDGEPYRIDGWIIDLPRCQKMIETFTPDYVIHTLYAGDRGTRDVAKFRGWKYELELNYEQHISADTLREMNRALNISKQDRLVIIPHRDRPWYQYNVRWSGEVELSRVGVSPGHRGVAWKLIGTENVAFPANHSGYGTNYGVDYGSSGW